ncbi:MAG: hypothetical protein ACP5NN_01730 [Methanolinea sp.]
MRTGVLMPVLLVASACIPLLGLLGTPTLPAAIIIGAACILAGYLVSRAGRNDPVLFLIVQPCMALCWYVSPILTVALETVLVLGLLYSLGLLSGGENLALPVLFLMVIAAIAVLLSTLPHVFVPLSLFIPVAALTWLAILGLAYRTTAHTRGDAP